MPNALLAAVALADGAHFCGQLPRVDSSIRCGMHANGALGLAFALALAREAA